MDNLKPCPFCGGEAHVQHQIHKVGLDFLDWYGVYCKNPFCGHVCGHDTEAEAIAAWNTRSERTCVSVFDGNMDGTSICSKCGGEFPQDPDRRWGLNYCPNCGARVKK